MPGNRSCFQKLLFLAADRNIAYSYPQEITMLVDDLTLLQVVDMIPNKGFHLYFHIKKKSGGTKREEPGIENALCGSMLFSGSSVVL